MDTELIIIISVSAFILLFYFISRKYKQKTIVNDEWQPFPERQSKKTKAKPEPKMFNIPEQKKRSFLFIPFLSPYVQKLKSKRKHKVKHQHQEDFFAEHGLAARKPKNDFEKLQRVLRKHYYIKKDDPDKTFKKLKRHVRTTSKHKKPKEPVHKDTFSKLHEIIHKK